MMLKLIIYGLVICFTAGCQNPCELYKKAACKNKNSASCHEAMQKIPDMTFSECQERRMVLKSGIQVEP